MKKTRKKERPKRKKEERPRAKPEFRQEGAFLEFQK
jgi:hypothetical protein